MPEWAFLQNKYVYSSRARISAFDLAIQRGYAVFDFIKIVHNRPLFAEEHLKRFSRSSAAMRLPIPAGNEELYRLICGLAEKNNMEGISGIRITLTGGESDDGYRIAEPVLVMTQHAFSLPSSEEWHKGLKLVSWQYERPLPEVKTTDYLMAVWLQSFIHEQGADDVLYTSGDLVTECPRSNFFMVTRGGQIVTPAEKILHGITRTRVLRLAEKIYPVEIRPISITEVYEAREAFVTSTTRDLLPVSHLNGHPVGEQASRPVAGHLITLLHAEYPGSSLGKIP